MSNKMGIIPLMLAGLSLGMYTGEGSNRGSRLRLSKLGKPGKASGKKRQKRKANKKRRKQGRSK